MASSGSRHFFPLTNLQIGDLQAYLSCLTIFLAPNSRRFFILVDNRPWLIDQGPRPAHLWQLMVTKSRFSPFANTRTRRMRSGNGKRFSFSNLPRTSSMKKGPSRFYSLIDAAMRQKKALLPVKKLKDSRLLHEELHRTLYGFIVFEVDWDHVRGINYLNELQVDTSMALEAKLMKRWEFDSIEQSSVLISSWFSGSYLERGLLREYLDSVYTKADVFYDAQDDILTPEGDNYSAYNDDFHGNEHSYEDSGSVCCSGEMDVTLIPPYTPPHSSPYKRRKIIKPDYGDDALGSEDASSEIMNTPRSSASTSSLFSCDNQNTRFSLEGATYKDVFISFRFDDHDLPFKLKEVIVSDLRLLRLLEYGLPSWVIFLQSYPVFCKIYRPWMCPLARFLYVLISIVTVLIGFYDLYKNVPLLKATLSRLFGPFFDWIETWEMISRLKYLGTMLFLTNFEQAVLWSLKITRATKSVLTVLTRPIAGPVIEIMELFFPLWNICIETAECLCSAAWIILDTSCDVVINMVQTIVWPFWFVFSTVLGAVTCVILPMVWVLCEILAAPVKLVISLASFVVVLLGNIYSLSLETWSSMSALFQFSSVSKASVGAYEASIWRSLWTDLFSQVFRALRSILYGFIAFFSTCNRHRLSIYNHIREFFRHLSHPRNAHCSETRQNYTKDDTLQEHKMPRMR